VTTERNVPLLLRFADCVPVLFWDEVLPAVGLAHAGWRGVAANIAAETVRVMVDRLGCRPENIWAGIGPAIGPCCYEVDADTAARVGDACPGGADICRAEGSGVMLDLPAAVRSQLEAAGIRRIEDSGICTSCSLEEFFSHRSENGRTGRFGVIIGLT
jgi:YfiH family protein